jgi:hypothetical protein
MENTENNSKKNVSIKVKSGEFIEIEGFRILTCLDSDGNTLKISQFDFHNFYLWGGKLTFDGESIVGISSHDIEYIKIY